MKSLLILLAALTLASCQSPWITTENTNRAEQYRSHKYNIGVPTGIYKKNDNDG